MKQKEMNECEHTGSVSLGCRGYLVPVQRLCEDNTENVRHEFLMERGGGEGGDLRNKDLQDCWR